jgi:RecJ-like exonuclease
MRKAAEYVIWFLKLAAMIILLVPGICLVYIGKQLCEAARWLGKGNAKQITGKHVTRTVKKICTKCAGYGYYGQETCYRCDGTGEIWTSVSWYVVNGYVDDAERVDI